MKLPKPCLALAICIGTCSAAHAENDSRWQLGVDGGTTVYADDQDARFVGLSLTREFGSGYVQLAVSTVDGGSAQGVRNAVPVESESIALSVGQSFGDIGVDTYLSLGRRRFDPEPVAGGRASFNSNGSSFALGGALTYDTALSVHLILSPYVAVDFDKVDIGRIVNLPNGAVHAMKSSESGVTGSAGIILQKFFGPDGAHSVGFHTAFVATSNNSAARADSGGKVFHRIISARNGPGQAEEWAEFGASASFAIADKWRFHVNASRTFGLAGPDATSLIAGISLRL